MLMCIFSVYTSTATHWLAHKENKIEPHAKLQHIWDKHTHSNTHKKTLPVTDTGTTCQ